MKLLALSSRRHLVKHPLRLLLAIAGVALGVSVVVAVDLVNASAERAFRLSTEAVAGKATHQISAGSAGLDERLFTRLASMPAQVPLAPVVDDTVVVIERSRALRLLGVDPFSERPFRSLLAPAGAGGDFTRLLTQPGAVVLSQETARDLGLIVDQAFRIRVGTREETLRLVGTLAPRDETTRAALSNLALTDLATAQEVLGRVGRLSRIELVLSDEEGSPRLAALRSALPPEAVLSRTASRSESLARMTAAFRLNLRALSLLALLCGALLIYNTMSFSVVERRALFGLLRAVGTSRRQIFGLVAREALEIGVVGSFLGAVAGVLLGKGLVVLVTQTIQDLYFTLSVREAAAAWGSVARGVTVGVAASLIAALAPAREATSTEPRATLVRSVLERGARRTARRGAWLGLALWLLAALLLWIDTASLPLAFLALFAVLAGAALVSPQATALLAVAMGLLMSRRRGLLGRMAARGVVSSLSRTGVAVAALSIAVATTIGVDLMIASFRTAVATWLEGTLAADIYVAAPTRIGSAANLALPEDLPTRVRAIPGVERVNTLRTTVVERPGDDALRVSGIDLDRRGFASFRLVGGDPDQAFAGFERGEVLISDPFAYRRKLGAGDTIELPTVAGVRPFRIAAVFRDYGSDQGVMVIADRSFRALWPSVPVAALSVFANQGADAMALERTLRDVARPGEAFLVESSRSLRQGSLEIFDRTFRVTGVLRLLTLAVAVIGVLAALTALELERAREFAVLRANGLLPRQLVALILGETTLLGLAAGLFAVPLGTTLAALLIYVVNRRSFGWTMELAITPRPFVVALGLSILAAWVAGIYPAWRSSRTSPAAALRSE